MSKDAASNGGGNSYDRSLALAISVALHVAAFGWMWFIGHQAGSGESEASGHSGSNGVSAGFIAADEFRQRIETITTFATSEVAAATEESSENAPSAPTERAVDLSDNTKLVDSDHSHAPGVPAVEENEAVLPGPMEAGLTQGGDNVGGNADDGLRAAYLAALREAIRQHWSYQGTPQQCNLTIKQSTGGAVLSAIAGECLLAPQDRRALEAAVLMAQPLPYSGFESVYSDTLSLEFQEN